MKLVNKIKVALFAITVSLLVISCATNGYGCKGNSKIITRVR